MFIRRSNCNLCPNTNSPLHTCYLHYILLPSSQLIIRLIVCTKFDRLLFIFTKNEKEIKDIPKVYYMLNDIIVKI